MDDTTPGGFDSLKPFLTRESLTASSSDNGKSQLEDAGEKAFRDYLEQHGGALLQRILGQGLSMDENSFPFVLSYLTLAQFRAAAQVPNKIDAAVASAQVALVKELKALHTQHLTNMAGLNAEVGKKLTDLAAALKSADSLASKLSFPDADKIKAAAESNAQTAQAIANAASVINRHLAAFRVWHLIVFAVVAILYFAGGAWLVQRDHHRVQSTIYQHVAARTTQALARIQPDELRQHVQALKDLLDLGVYFSLSHDIASGDVVLTLEGRDGVTLYYPRETNGKYCINVSQ
jgi:hypothetical protein